MESLGDEHDELLTINIGPHHPATHGVLRLFTTLEGEIVRDVKPIIGYVHTGIEKSCEDQQYWKVIPFVERMDYLAYYFNAMAFCMAVERLLDEEVPERAQRLRVIHLELNRIASHLFLIAIGALWTSARSRCSGGARRDRDLALDLFEMSGGQRFHALLPGRRRGRGHPARLRGEDAARSSRPCGPAFRSTSRCWTATRSGCSARRTRASCRRSDLLALGVTGPLLRATGHPWDLRKAAPYSGYENFDFNVPVGTVGDNYDRFRVRGGDARVTEDHRAGARRPARGPLHHDQPQGRAAAAPRAGHLDGGAIHHFPARPRASPSRLGETYVAIEPPRGESAATCWPTAPPSPPACTCATRAS